MNTVDVLCSLLFDSSSGQFVKCFRLVTALQRFRAHVLK